MEKTKVLIVNGQDGFDGYFIYDASDESQENMLDEYPYDNSLDITEQEDAIISWIQEEYDVIEIWNDLGLFRKNSSGTYTLVK